MSRRFREYRFYIPPDVLVEFHALASSLKIHTVSPEEAQIWIVDSSTSDYSNLQQIWSLIILDVEWLRACSEAGNKFIGEREDFGGYRLDSSNSYEPTGSASIPAHYPQHDATIFGGFDPYVSLPPSHASEHLAHDAQLPYSGRGASVGAEWAKEESNDGYSRADGSEERGTEEPEEKQDEWSTEERMTLLDVLSAAGTQTKAFIAFSEQSGTRTANMATHYYRKNRDWYEGQLSARGVALSGSDPYTDKEKTDLVEYICTMAPSKAFRHFAATHLHRSAKSTREQYDANVNWYTEEIEKRGGSWSSKAAPAEKEKPPKPEAASLRMSTWQKPERDYIVECIATEANFEEAWKKVHERFPRRTPTAIKAQYQSGLVGRRATWNALVDAYKNGKTDLSDVAYISASRHDDKESHAAAAEAAGVAPPPEKDTKYWTLAEKEILLELLVEEDNLMECFRKFHVACPNRTVSSVKAQFYQREDWYRERLEEQGIIKDADFGTHGATPWSEAEIETLKDCIAHSASPNQAYEMFKPQYPDRSANAVKMQARALKTKGLAKYLDRGPMSDDEDEYDDLDDKHTRRTAALYRPATARATRATRARKRELEELESESEEEESDEEDPSPEPDAKKPRLEEGSSSSKSFAEAMQEGEDGKEDVQMGEQASHDPEPQPSASTSSAALPTTAAFPPAASPAALPISDSRTPLDIASELPSSRLPADLDASNLI